MFLIELYIIMHVPVHRDLSYIYIYTLYIVFIYVIFMSVAFAYIIRSKTHVCTYIIHTLKVYAPEIPIFTALRWEVSCGAPIWR